MSQLIATLPPRRYGTIGDHARILSAVLYAEALGKWGASGLGLLLEIVEPLADMGVLVLWHYSMRVFPVYGTSIVLFISTGILPVFVFIHLSTKFLEVMRTKGQRFPQISDDHVMLAKAVLTTLTYAATGILLFSAERWYITSLAVPSRPEKVMLSVLSLLAMGVGMALVNGVIGAVLPFWKYVWSALSRLCIIFCGVLYVPDLLPPNLRSYIMWNPVSQSVSLFRQGFYPTYPTMTFMPTYLALCSVGILAFGLCLQRTFKMSFNRN